MESLGYVIPDVTKEGIELRPDISVGQLFAKFLKTTMPGQTDLYKFYTHLLPNGMKIKARQYKIELLPLFIKFLNDEWIPKKAYAHFEKRDPEALKYLTKLIEAK